MRSIPNRQATRHRLAAAPRFAPLRSLVLLLLVVAGCDEAPAAPKYYERVIQPILTNSCVRNVAKCHADDGTGNAPGNVDMTSYANLVRRRDLLHTFGVYPVPLLLLKATGPQVPPIAYQGSGDGTMTVSLPSQIQHVGLNNITADSDAYLTLQRWMDSGANEDGSITVRQKQTGSGACRKDINVVRPDVAALVGTVDVTSKPFKDFAANVEPVLGKNCAVGTCHSSQQSDFFLACQGSGSDDLSKFNFLEAQEYVAPTQQASLILVKPLAPSAGGVSHTGGVFFANKDDSDWQNMAAWAAEVGPQISAQTLTQGEQFFRDHVMPVFLQRGCSLEACHSPGAANDFKLHQGSPGGFYSQFALEFNYKEARNNFLVADIPDVRQTRLVKKPAILKGGIGLTHRGGPPLQDGSDPLDLDPTKCPQPWSAASSAYCTIVEWHRIERLSMLTAGTADPFAAGTRIQLAVVERPADADRLIDFDNYHAGADLRLGSVTTNALGAIDEGGASDDGSLITKCGVPAGMADVRHPNVSMDATRVAFAMRTSAADSLDIYEVQLADGTCTKITDGNGQSMNGIKIHNLDPVYAFDGSLVFASTRGRPSVGPTRSLKYLLPQTDLWRMRPNGSGGYLPPEQMTVLLGSELNPEMMLNGELSFTAEKASADFYQLSGRRINWDLTDYHPLLGQRANSVGIGSSDIKPGDAMTPSVGYSQATEIREGIDRNFVLIFSDVGAKGAGGTLATFNRSIGPFEADRINDINFLQSVTFLDPAATGRVGATQGAYRSPFSLPDGRYLVSYDPAITDLSSQTPRYDLMVFDPRTSARTPVANFVGGVSHVEGVLIYKREARPMFDNLTQLVFGGRVDPSDLSHAQLHCPDLPMLGTLLGANLRTGRFVDKLRPAKKLAIYEDQAPPSDPAAAMAGLAGTQMVYQNRKLLGTVPLAGDGSILVQLPSLTPLIFELLDDKDGKLFTMAEEDQLGPGERISRGVPQGFFNSVCAGCHGSVSGIELDIALNQDALTGASVSQSRDAPPLQVGP